MLSNNLDVLNRTVRANVQRDNTAFALAALPFAASGQAAARGRFVEIGGGDFALEG